MYKLQHLRQTETPIGQLNLLSNKWNIKLLHKKTKLIADPFIKHSDLAPLNTIC